MMPKPIKFNIFVQLVLADFDECAAEFFINDHLIVEKHLNIFEIVEIDYILMVLSEI